MVEGEVGSGAAREIPVVDVETLERDPHGTFAHYRPHVPFIRRADGGLLILRAEDVQGLAVGPRVRQGETELPRLRGIAEGPILDALQYGMITSNGTAHRQRRAPFSAPFAHRVITELRPMVREVIANLIDRHIGAGRMEFVDDFAAQVPMGIIGRILGLRDSEIGHFAGLVYTATRIFSFSFTAADVPVISAAMGELQEQAGRLVKERRMSPRDDLLSRCVAAVDEAGELSALETIMQIVTLIIGGIDTTRVAMTAQTALLLQQRNQWLAVCADPSLVPGTVAESLRYEPSVGSIGRFMLETVELDGHILPAGQYITLSTMSAMRDPALFRDPDRFDIRRTDQLRSHMVFGAGAHRCLGEVLARMELEEALAALAARMPSLRLAGAPSLPRGHFGIRRVEPMPVEWEVAA